MVGYPTSRANAALAALLFFFLAARTRADQTCSAEGEGACNIEDAASDATCDIAQMTMGEIDKEQWQKMMEGDEPFVVNGVFDAVSYDQFLEKKGGMMVVPRVSMELMVDGRLTYEGHESRRPTLSVRDYLKHKNEPNQQIEGFLYGQVVSESEVEARAAVKDKKDNIATPTRATIFEDTVSKNMMDLIGLEDKMNVLFLSPDKDSALPFQAHDISFHANVAGEQTWVFYSPEGVPNLVSSHFILSDIDGNYLSGLSKNKRPKFCTTKPGSVVVIPKYWHHARVSQTPAVTLGLMVPHTGVKAPKNAKDKTTASQLDSEIEEYPFVHQLHVDRAILAVKSDPKQCLSSMKKAVEVSPNNVALRWQVARLFSKIGAKSEALEMTSKTIKMLADTTKQKMPGKDDDKGEDSDEDEDVNKPWSPKYAGLHWSKFGQLLLFDLKMPLEAIICFQMRLHLTPEDTNTVLLKSRALTMMGALDEAKITLQDAQKADPKNDQLKTMLEELNSDEAKNLVETMKAMKGTGAGFGNDKFSLEALEKIKTEDGRIAMPSFAAVSS